MIRFFVSSTFKDMREERAHLHGIVLPEVRAYADGLGEFVDICDLRWGIDLGNELDELDKYFQLMNICLDAIDECKGYMICFLGDSYGTQLDEGEAEAFESIWRSRRPEALGSYRISLTQMELEYGLLHGDADKCLCFRRNCLDDPVSESQEQIALQAELVRAVSDSCPAENYLEYEAEWNAQGGTARLGSDFDQMLIDAMKRVIDKQMTVRQRYSWVEREQAVAHALAEDLHSSFAGREAQLDQLDRLLQKHHCVVVYGESGIGKSSFIAQWLWTRHLLREQACHYISCGWGERSKTVLDVATQLIHLIKNTILSLDGKQPDLRIEEFARESNAFKKLEDLIRTYDAKLGQRGKRGYIVLDAVNQLVALDGESGFAWLLTLRLTHLNIVLSSIERLDDKSGSVGDFGSGSEEDDRHLHLTELTDEDVREIIRRQMYRVGNAATKMVLEPIRSKRDHAKPLYLRGILDILKMKLGSIQTGDNQQVFAHHRKEIERIGDTVDELVWQVLNEAARYTGSSIVYSARSTLVDYQNYLGLIAASPFGLSDKDARDVLAVSADSWSPERSDAIEVLVRYCHLFLRSFFRSDENGRWTFGHSLVFLSVERHVDSRKSEELFCAYGAQHVRRLDLNEARRTLFFADVARASLSLGQTELFGALLAWANALENKARMLYDRTNKLGRYKSYHGLLVKTASQHIQDCGTDTYLHVVQAFPDELQAALTGALSPVTGRLSPDRRISAMRAASIFVKEVCGSGVPTSMGFYWLLKQLIDIFDDTSRQAEAFALLQIACNYLADLSLSDYGDADKLKLISLANLVFFCSNKLIKDKIDNDVRIDPQDPGLEKRLEELDEEASERFSISNTLLAWYEREIEGHDDIIGNPLLAERCAAYTNNVGQRYNALYRVDKSFPYRMRAQTIKVSEVMRILKLEDALDDFIVLCGQETPKSIGDHKVLAQAHARFWNELTIVAPEEESAEYRAASRYLESIATTYLALGSDYFYWPKLQTAKLALSKVALWYQIGLCYLGLSARLMELEGFPVKQKQLAVVLIRQVGMKAEWLDWYAHNLDQTGHLDLEKERQDFDTISTRASNLYFNHARFDFQEGKKLREAVKKGARALEDLTGEIQKTKMQLHVDVFAERLDSASNAEKGM